MAVDGYTRRGINFCFNAGSRRERGQPEEWKGESHRPGAWILWGLTEKDSEGHLSFWLEHQVALLNERHTGEAASARGTDERLSFRQVKVPEETR